MRFLAPAVCVLVVGICLSSVNSADQAPSPFSELADEYSKQIQPIVKRFCVSCHSTEEREGEFDLERFSTFADVRLDSEVWVRVVEMLDGGEMPPKDSDQPSDAEHKQLRSWAARYLDAEALANAGDPGPVVLRRLNNAEYTYTIHELTGIELDPAREFPADSAAGEGFTNAGNALVMSPGLLRKYLDAAKEVAAHAVLLPEGFRFSRHTTRRDWTDEILDAIRDTYRETTETSKLGVGTIVGNLNVHGNTRIGLASRLPLEKCFAATLAERVALRSGARTIDSVARERGLSSRYLEALWTALNGTTPSPLLDELRAQWADAAPADADKLAATVAQWQQGLWTFGPVGLIGRKGGPQRWMEPVSPLASEQEMRFSFPTPAKDSKEKAEDKEKVPPTELTLSLVVTDAGDGNEHDVVLWKSPRLVLKGQPDILLRDVRTLAPSDGRSWGVDPGLFGRHPDGGEVEADSICVRAPSVLTVSLPSTLAIGREFVTTAALEEKSAAKGSAQVALVEGGAKAETGLIPSQVIVRFSTVTQVFSDRRDLFHSRPILVAEENAARKRFESAFDAHRALFPAALAYTQIVPVDEVLTLIGFYREDEHLVRLLLDDRQEARLDRLWDELHYVSQSALQEEQGLELLLEVMTGNNQYQAVQPLYEPMKKRAAEFRKQIVDDEPKQLQALLDFAAQAYRRPLHADEGEQLRDVYRKLREQELSHDEAFRLTLARVFVASPFLYRLETVATGTAPALVSNEELATRLSYFLWSSPPDRELHAAAATGALHAPEILASHARRMVKDPRVRRLATEFLCQWLGIYEFDLLDEKSEKHFPEFQDLRADMYEESIRFFTDLIRSDASMLSLLDADHTFVNDRMAKFYGVSGVESAAWMRIDGMRDHGRGGILGLATTLAKHSSVSRTSPILRGNWVSEVLLGERLPRPPKEVPELPGDETSTDGLTVRQLVEKHTTDPLCSGCHERIDPFGFALEAFDTIGRRRAQDLAGRPIDTKTRLRDGSELRGLLGLRSYLLETRREAFLRQLCRKLLGYALGREVQLSDEPLLTEMRERLEKNNYRWSVAVETIVLSRQFRTIRPVGGQRARF